MRRNVLGPAGLSRECLSFEYLGVSSLFQQKKSVSWVDGWMDGMGWIRLDWMMLAVFSCLFVVGVWSVEIDIC